MSQKVEIDEVDTKILRMLVKDARTNLTAIAKNCSLSVNAIHKRVKVTNLIRKFAYLIHLDRSIGKYDICAFVIVKDIKQIELLKESIRKHVGVKRIAVNFWGKTCFNFGNIGLLQTRVEING
jgi:DNA-binding Lrp family transcriptional regulator